MSVCKPNKRGANSKDTKVAKFNLEKEKQLMFVAEEVNAIYPQFDYFIEVYNDNSVIKLPDVIGINVFYPSFKKATHWKSQQMPISANDTQLKNYIIEMCKQLLEKIPNGNS